MIVVCTREAFLRRKRVREVILCLWFFLSCSFWQSKRKLLESFTQTHTQTQPKNKGFVEMNYICQMCIKLAYITIYFGLHLQYIIHICDVLLLVLFCARACVFAVLFFYMLRKPFCNFRCSHFKTVLAPFPRSQRNFLFLKFSNLIFNFFHYHGP